MFQRKKPVASEQASDSWIQSKTLFLNLLRVLLERSRIPIPDTLNRGLATSLLNTDLWLDVYLLSKSGLTVPLGELKYHGFDKNGKVLLGQHDGGKKCAYSLFEINWRHTRIVILTSEPRSQDRY